MKFETRNEEIGVDDIWNGAQKYAYEFGPEETADYLKSMARRYEDIDKCRSLTIAEQRYLTSNVDKEGFSKLSKPIGGIRCTLFDCDTTKDRTNEQRRTAVEAFGRLMAVSENICRDGLDADDTAAVFLAVTLNLVWETSWGDNAVGFLRSAAEEYDGEAIEWFLRLDSEIEAERIRHGPGHRKDMT